MQKQPRRRFTDAFKAQAVTLSDSVGRTEVVPIPVDQCGPGARIEGATLGLPEQVEAAHEPHLSRAFVHSHTMIDRASNASGKRRDDPRRLVATSR